MWTNTKNKGIFVAIKLDKEYVMKKIITLVSLATIISLSGCATPVSDHNNYRGYESGVAQQVNYGVVDSVRPVMINNENTGVGVATGAVLGGLLGSTIGHGRGSIAAGVAGAVAGGVAGQAVERNNSQVPGVEIVVRLENGRTIAVTQPDSERFYRGDRVRILTANGKTRVTR